MGTLAFAVAINGAAVALITISMAAFRRKRGTTIFAGSFVSSSLAFLLFLRQASLGPFLGVLAPNILMTLSYFGLAWGLRSILGFARGWSRRFTAYFIVFIALLCAATFLSPSLLIRTAIGSSFIVLVSAEFLYALHRGPRSVPFVVRGAVTSFVAGFICLHAARLILLFLEDDFGFSLLDDSFINAYTYLFTIVSSVLWAGSILGIDAADLVTELERKNEMLRNLAVVDELTGLSNRRLLDSMLAAEIERSERYGDPLSFILFDIDYFKNINDNWGHSVGDDVLKEIARTAEARIREPDCLFRWGGDEFVVLAPHTGLEGAAALAEHLRTEVNARDFPVVGPIALSCGVAEWRSRMSADRLFSLADQALYRAKLAGRNRVAAMRDEEG